jgi:hypothetical protein
MFVESEMIDSYELYLAARRERARMTGELFARAFQAVSGALRRLPRNLRGRLLRRSVRLVRV